MDLDELLTHVGEWNTYQYLLLLLVCFPMCIPCGVNAFVQIFTAFEPDHWCKVPELLDSNLTVEQRKALSIPFEGSSFSRCTYYDLNYTSILEGKLPEDLSNLPVKECDRGWEYDLSQVESSVVVDFELVCSREILPTVALALLNVGGFLGVFIFGYVNDRLGRRMSYFICLTTMIVFGFASALATEYFSWSIFRLLLGLTIPAILHIPFVICLEVVGPSRRTLVSFISNMFYVLGLCIICGLAYLIRDWRYLYYATSLPFVIFYIYWFFLPESLRWMLATGKVEESEKVLRKIAAVNKKQPSDEIWRQFKTQAEREYEANKELRQGSQAGLWDLFRTPNMRTKTILITFSWIVNEAVYVGLSYYGPAMGSDPHLSFFLGCIVEIPGYLLCYLLMDRWGRRILLCACMFLSGIASVATPLLPSDAVISTLVLYLIAKMSIAAGTMIIFQFGGELYPTEVRGIGLGFSAYLGGFSLITIPFINYLGANLLVLPIVILGIFCLIGGLASLRLPETLNQKLPQTLQEGEVFGKDHKWFGSQSLDYIKDSFGLKKSPQLESSDL